MALQITSTDDVGYISAASNVDASIKWYCYERPFSTGTTIYVQREVDGVLEAEVRFLAEGERPEIFFDPVQSEWIFTYILNENLFMITIDETDPPVTQSAQTGTIIDHLRTVYATKPDPETTQQELSRRNVGRGATDVDDTKAIDSLSVGASLDPGNTVVVRWTAVTSTFSNLNLNVAGFNVYVRRAPDGALIRVNDDLIPFQGFSIVHEAEVPATPGRYYVTQVNFKGTSSSQLVEGRIKPPYDTIKSDGVHLPTVITSIMGQRFGEGARPEDLRFVIVETAAVNVIPPFDSFLQQAFGEGIANVVTISFDYDVVQVISGTSQPIQDVYVQQAFGEGMFLFLSGSDFGVINVG